MSYPKKEKLFEIIQWDQVERVEGDVLAGPYIEYLFAVNSTILAHENCKDFDRYDFWIVEKKDTAEWYVHWIPKVAAAVANMGRVEVMPILVKSRGGRLVEVDTNTGKIVDHIDVRDGIAHYMAADGQVLESKAIGITHRFVCTACGERCEAANLTGDRPDCPKGYMEPGWKES